jgi:hypothetical protein
VHELVGLLGKAELVQIEEHLGGVGIGGPAISDETGLGSA